MAHYDRLGKVGISEVMAAIGRHLADPLRAPRKATWHGASVSLGGLRLQTFFQSPPCCSNPDCGMTPQFFAIERTRLPVDRPATSPHHRYHLNLYGLDKGGNEVLFTHDHTLARGLGGSDTRDNTTMMCSPCNRRKAALESKIANRNHRLARGESPESIGEPSEKKMARQTKLLHDEAQFHNMPVEQFIAYCDELAMQRRQGHRVTEVHGESRRKIAKGLGMSLEGYIQLRHMHNERMMPQFAPTHKRMRA